MNREPSLRVVADCFGIDERDAAAGMERLAEHDLLIVAAPPRHVPGQRLLEELG